ncbi:cellulose binding domain-containing protein [Agromyces sp. MMS24-JH15]|uniref:cellulose binding domain-containing protein n=1 Tax=Agromyces sp. MMS24-JH15 TaxID=3243765 RepID=UPI003747A059
MSAVHRVPRAVPARGRRALAATAAVGVATVGGLVATLVAFAPHAADPIDAFVEVCETAFCVDGAPTAFAGANAPDLVGLDEDALDRRLAALATLGVDLVRVPAFPVAVVGEASTGDEARAEPQAGSVPAAGAIDDESLAGLDAVLDAARSHGIRVIPVLAAGGVDDDGLRIPADCADCGDRAADAAGAVVARVNARTGVAYGDDPTILAWDLADDPHVDGDPTADASGAALRDWIHRVGERVREADPNHLVTVGVDGQGAEFAAGPDGGAPYVPTCANRYVDFCSAKLFPTEEPGELSPAAAAAAVQRYLADAHDLIGKPFLLAAFNAHANVRAEYWTAIYRALEEHGADASAFWAFQASTASRGTYGVQPDDPELELVRAHAEAVHGRGDTLASDGRPTPTAGAPTVRATPIPTPTPTPTPKATPTPTPTPTATPTPTPGDPAVPPPSEPSPPAAVVACAVTTSVDDWGSGYNANLTVTNLGDEPIDGWALSFDLGGGQKAGSSWGADVSQTGRTVTATGAGWNAVIPAGGSVGFGLNATSNGQSPALTGFRLNGASCG